MAGQFAPKTQVNLAPPKDDKISIDYLAKCDGSNEGYPTYVCILGRVFDVSTNGAYGSAGNYRLFAGKDPSCALGRSSLKPEDCHSDISSLTEKEIGVLKDWYTFFSKRYNQVGVVEEYLKPELIASIQS